MAFRATDFKIRKIERRLRIASSDNWRVTFWLVPAEFNCPGLISNPCLVLGNVPHLPKQYNRSINLLFDENCIPRLECERYVLVAIRACRDKDDGEDWFSASPKDPKKVHFNSFYNWAVTKCLMMFRS